ncbi:MAG: CHAT domain-containing protein [Cyclobacteriaceae bacterium]
MNERVRDRTSFFCFVYFFSFCVLFAAWPLSVLADKAPVGHKLLEAGDSLYILKQNQEALKKYKLAANYYEQQNMSDSLVFVKLKIARTYLQSGRYKESLERIDSVLLNHVDSKTNPVLLAHIWYYKGECSYFLSDAQPALLAHKKALLLRDEYLEKPHTDFVRSYMGLGNVYRYEMHEYAEATEYYIKAVDMLDNIENAPEDLIFWSYYNLSSLWRSRKKLDQATIYAHELIKIAEKSDNATYVEYAYTAMANLLADKNEYNQALVYYKKIIHEIEAKQLGSNYLYFICLENLASIYINSNQHDSALSVLKKAQSIFDQGKLDNPILLAGLYIKLATVMLAKDNIDRSVHYTNLSIEIATKAVGKKHPMLARALIFKGNLLNKKSLVEEALSFYQQGLISAIPEFENKDLETNPALDHIATATIGFDALLKKGLALSDLADTNNDFQLFENAHNTFLLADSLFEKTQRNNLLESDEMLNAGEIMLLYEQALYCAYKLYELSEEQQYLDQIHLWIEKNKSRILQKSIQKASALKLSGVPDSLIQMQTDLQLQLAQFQRISNPAPEQSAKKVEILKKLESFYLLLENQYPSYFQFQQAGQSVSLAELSLKARKDNMVIAQYFMGQKHLFMLFVSDGIPKAHRLELNATFYSHIKNLQENILGQDITGHLNFMKFVQAAHYLYINLLDPGIKHMNKALVESDSPKTLLIIPDGSLALFPFECLISALPTNTASVNYAALPFLVHQFDISYTYSAALYLNQMKPITGEYKGKALAFAYSELSTDHNPSTFSTLHGAIEEVNQLRNFFPFDSFLEEKATKQAFLESVEKYKLIHLAVHGTSDSPEDQNTRLVFNADEDTTGSLFSYEMYALNLVAELAVLSACESGLGTVNAGEGVFSMARSFFYAGCPAVIMSLSKLNDKSSVKIIHHLYEKLLQGNKKHVALGEAKRKYLSRADAYTAHPNYWAALVMLGDTSPLHIEPENNKNRTIAVFAIALFIILSAFLIWNRSHKTNGSRK